MHLTTTNVENMGKWFENKEQKELGRRERSKLFGEWRMHEKKRDKRDKKGDSAAENYSNSNTVRKLK